ncbi:hypothetical protein VTH06DRAFT_4899 [Thermothelomyces fergusii]
MLSAAQAQPLRYADGTRHLPIENWTELQLRWHAWTVVAQLAVLKAGGAFVNLDPSHPDSRLRQLIEDVNAQIVLCSPTHSEKFASYTFDASIMETLSCLLVGGCVCVPSDEAKMNDLAAVIRNMDVTWTLLTPSVASTLKPESVPCLKTFATGGEAMAAGHIERWGTRCALVNAYGPTECSVVATTSTKVDESHRVLNKDRSTIGTAVGGRIWVVDPENHNRLSMWRDGDRMYKTGDLVRYNSDGSISYISRKDTQIKLNGRRIELEYRLGATPASTEHRGPSSETEKKLQSLWESVLGLSAGSVGPDDSFFRLGGDSLTAMRLVGAARAHKMNLTILDIFEKPVLTDMARACDGLGTVTTPAPELKPFDLISPSELFSLLEEVSTLCGVPRNKIQDMYPCSPLQEGLVTLSSKQMGAYVAVNTLALPDNIDLQCFKASWQVVVDETDILRTRIAHTASSGFLQIVIAPEPIVWHNESSLEVAVAKGQSLGLGSGGNDDVIFGETLAGRNVSVPGVEEMAGPTFTTVPTRVRLDRGMRLDEFLRALHTMATQLVPHQHLGIQHIKRLNPDCFAACEFTNLLVIQTASSTTSPNGRPQQDLDNTDWDFQGGSSSETFFTHPLVLECTAADNKIEVTFHYDERVLTPWHAKRLAHQFQAVLKRLVEKSALSGAKLGDIQAISPEDLSLIARWNRSSQLEAVEACIHDLFLNQASAQPDKIGISAWDAELTYSQIRDYSSRLALHLRQLGAASRNSSRLMVQCSTIFPRCMVTIFPLPPTPKTRLARWAHRVELMNGYGPTEASVLAVINPHVSTEKDHTTIGRGTPAARLWIVDPRENCNDRLVPVGAVGELAISGPLLSRGYLGDPEKTSQTGSSSSWVAATGKSKLMANA